MRCVPILLAALTLFTVPARPATSKVHDPSSIVRCSGTNWFFSTGSGIKSFYSADLASWAEGPAIFPSPPAWHEQLVPGNRGYLWAPDVLKRGGRYWLYYSVSTFGKNTSAIGLATSPTLDPSDPKYAWKDEGLVIRSGPADPFNAIDPCVLACPDGKLRMVFGSYWSGIFELELDPVTGRPKKGADPERLAWNKDIEASALIFHDGYYYLFVNWGVCCKGTDSTYEIRVGRGRNPKGPFRDKDGKDMVRGGGTPFLASEGRFVGPGHFASVEGAPCFAFHYYNADDRGLAQLGIRELKWGLDGWPQPGAWVFPLQEAKAKAEEISDGAGSAKSPNSIKPLR